VKAKAKVKAAPKVNAKLTFRRGRCEIFLNTKKCLKKLFRRETNSVCLLQLELSTLSFCLRVSNSGFFSPKSECDQRWRFVL